MAANSRLQTKPAAVFNTQTLAANHREIVVPPPPMPPPLPPPCESSLKKVRTRDNKKREGLRKGLRHFSIRVCHIVESKKQATHNEVADALVAEERFYRQQFPVSNPLDSSIASPSKNQHSALTNTGELQPPLVDEKNIRRRVYDSLNVLIALNVMKRENKRIEWNGFDALRAILSESAQVRDFKRTAEDKRKRILEKQALLKEIQNRKEDIEALIQRRQGEEQILVSSSANNNILAHSIPSMYRCENSQRRLHFPFLIVRTNKDTDIIMSLAESGEEIDFDFGSPISLMLESDILRLMTQQVPQEQTQTLIDE